MSVKLALTEELRGSVREAIINHELEPGSRVNELQLSAQLNVSRTPLREALRSLEQEGLVVFEPNRGFFVPALSESEVRESYPILWSLEALALELSGPLLFILPPELERINAKFLKAKNNPELALQFDAEFHDCLLSKTPNRRLLSLITQMKLAVARYERVYMNEPSLVELSAKHHEAIVHALSSADWEKARAALVTNWKFGMEVVVGSLAKRK